MRLLTDRHLCFACFLLCLALNLACSAVGWRNTIRESHDSRQTQTALSARYLQREGLTLNYPLPLFGPPWSAPFEFPIYQGSVATLANVTGLPLEQAGRLTSLLYFYLTLPALFLLQGFLPIPRERRWLLLAAVLVSPVYAYYSRTFMIESTALCLASWFLLAFGRALTRPGVAWPVAAAVLAGAAALAKLPTFVVFLAPAALLTLRFLRDAGDARRRFILAGTALGIAATGLAVGLAWVRHTDAIKAGNPLAAAFVSTELREFVLGRPGDRVSPAFWQKIAAHTGGSVMPALNCLLLALFGLVLAARARLTVGALILGFATGPLVFSNLYAVHDYYFYAAGVFLLAALAIAWSGLLDLAVFPRPARWSVVLFSLAVQFGTFLVAYFPAQRQPQGPLELARALQALTDREDIVMAVGHDWNPGLAYESDRRAIMILDRMFGQPAAIEEVLRRVPDGQVTALVVAGHLRNYPAAVRPLLARLNLLNEPILLGPTDTVHGSAALAARAIDRLAGVPLPTLKLAAPPAEETTIPRQRHLVDRLSDPRVVAMFSPAPREILHPFGLAVHVLSGRDVTDAHAPTDIRFSPNPAAKRAEFEYGILPGAITAEFPTDGVLFRVELTQPGGPNRVLFSRQLSPLLVVADRGTQSGAVEIPDGATGDLVFRTLPGAGGSISSDWAYWARIDIR